MRKNSVFNNENSYLNNWYNITKGFGEFFKERNVDLKIPLEEVWKEVRFFSDSFMPVVV